MPARNRVLAVDDNIVNLQVVTEALRGVCELRTAHNGREALHIASEFRPDVVLLDVMMPWMDGLEVCRRMRNDPALPHTRIIMVSAKGAIDDRLQGYGVGADDYITKPFSEEELCSKVRVALRTVPAGELDAMERQLDKICGATGEILALMTQLRDMETGEHLVRIRACSHILAGELRQGPFGERIDDRFLDDLYYASVLHDVGKIGIPDSILRKPEQLTAEERQQMQRHTIIGEQILDRLARQQPAVTMFRMAARVARSHHERFDGRGYPDNLRGSEIPLAARIVKVADVFDAIVSPRVYKEAEDPSVAREEICRGKGCEFDPEIVDAMLLVFDELADVCQNDAHGEILELC